MAANTVDTVFESLGSMTVLELVELKKRIEDEWGITAAAPVAVAAPGAAGVAGGAGRGGASSVGCLADAASVRHVVYGPAPPERGHGRRPYPRRRTT